MNDTKSFRQCLGRFATGVTVVTCADARGNPCGITANSFSSVSLDPPLVLWNVAKSANSLEAFLNAEHFAINVLSAEQENLSAHFAQSDHMLFDGVEHNLSELGVPMLPDTLACFECRTYQVHDCGDHYIVIGEVIAYRAGDMSPLLFYAGNYRSLGTGH
jgi:flavin reductase (DIM6/NTAB) family NADH-FMN oxidoreductase RutF